MENNKQSQLNICSAYYSRESLELLKLNYEFVRKLNPDANFQWLVANNAPKDFTERLDDKKFNVYPGDGFSKERPSWIAGSYQHAAALNKLLQQVDTRYLLVLDIDFYIVRKNWISEILEYMRKNNLSFFGAPWHPKWKRKIRYFPAAHALFIDLKKINKSELDFAPDDEWARKPKPQKNGLIARKLLGARRVIGISKDTGYKIYEKFGNNKQFKRECVQPVFMEKSGIMDKVMPDQWSFVPKKRGYISKSGFAEADYFDAEGQGWEEFMWQGKPFGFHVRGSAKLKNHLTEKLNLIKSVLN